MTIKKPSIINVATVGPMSESRRMPQVEQSECAETRFASMPLDAAEHVDAGIWECSPGVFRREVTQREFSHFLEGYCTFVPDEGSPSSCAQAMRPIGRQTAEEPGTSMPGLGRPMSFSIDSSSC